MRLMLSAFSITPESFWIVAVFAFTRLLHKSFQPLLRGFDPFIGLAAFAVLHGKLLAFDAFSFGRMSGGSFLDKSGRVLA